MSKDDTKNKPDFLKKWWFWVIIIAIVAGAAVAVSRGGNGNQPTATQNPTVVGTNSNSTTNSDSAEGKEYSLGDVISVAGSKISVTAVERNYSTGNQYAVPKDGKEFVKVTVSIENTDNDSLAYNTYYWKIEDANGAVTTSAAETYTLADALNSGELTKGGKVSGSLIYEVPAGDSVKIHYQYSPVFSNKQVIIKI